MEGERMGVTGGGMRGEFDRRWRGRSDGVMKGKTASKGRKCSAH